MKKALISNFFTLTQLIAIIGFGVFCGLPAFAQYSPGGTMDLGMGYGQIALSQSIFSGTRQSGHHKTQKTGKSKSKTSPKKSTAKTDVLAFRWNDALTTQYRKELIDEASHKKPSDRAAVTRRLNSLNPTKTFRQLSYQYGLNPFSIPDLAATYCVASWEIVKGHKTTKPKIIHLRNLIRNEMQKSSYVTNTIRDASAKDKQFWLEEQAYEIILNRAAYQDLQRKQDVHQLKDFRTKLANNAKVRGFTLMSCRCRINL